MSAVDPSDGLMAEFHELGGLLLHQNSCPRAVDCRQAVYVKGTERSNYNKEGDYNPQTAPHYVQIVPQIKRIAHVAHLVSVPPVALISMRCS